MRYWLAGTDEPLTESELAVDPGVVGPKPGVSSTLFVLWTLALVTAPLYLWESGRPQISHLLLAAVAGVLVVLNRLAVARRFIPPLHSLSSFVIYAVVVNALWTLLHGGSEFGASAAYLVYSYVAFRAVLATYSLAGTSFVAVAVRTVAVAIIGLVPIAVLSAGGDSIRSSVLFNNPNQLAYYVVVSATLLVVGERYLPRSRVLFVGLLAACGYLMAVSNSKAGIAALAFLFLILLVVKPVAAVTLVVAVVVFAGSFAAGQSIADDVGTRLASSSTDETAEARGYGLIVEYPEMLAVGAGDGSYERFGLDHEIHSTWATVLFAYGVLGTLLFARFVLRIWRATGGVRILFLLPVAIYGLAHNGLRFTPVWILIALLLIVADFDREMLANGLLKRSGGPVVSARVAASEYR